MLYLPCKSPRPFMKGGRKGFLTRLHLNSEGTIIYGGKHADRSIRRW
jgi:hypothetical protein